MSLLCRDFRAVATAVRLCPGCRWTHRPRLADVLVALGVEVSVIREALDFLGDILTTIPSPGMRDPGFIADVMASSKEEAKSLLRQMKLA